MMILLSALKTPCETTAEIMKRLRASISTPATVFFAVMNWPPNGARVNDGDNRGRGEPTIVAWITLSIVNILKPIGRRFIIFFFGFLLGWQRLVANESHDSDWAGLATAASGPERGLISLVRAGLRSKRRPSSRSLAVTGRHGEQFERN